MFSTKLFKDFFASERLGSAVLIGTTVVSIFLANVGAADSLHAFFHSKFVGLSVEHWVNDGLMVIFFLLIGLELEREIYGGELSTWKSAALPAFAAIGGMAIPALIHFLFNQGLETISGAGIPMATDIAFSLGVLGLFATKVPYSLKVFLTALAIADDLGAILVIAVFYSKNFAVAYLILALCIFALLVILNRWRVSALWPYLIGGLAMWWCFLHSGVHATIAGVLLAFAIPFCKSTNECVSYRLLRRLHLPVALGVLPVFAFVNTCIPLESDRFARLFDPNCLGIFFGLVVGKPLGISVFCLLAIALGIGRLSDGLTLRHVVGAGLLAGIGFTMSIFVSILAFENPEDVKASQISVVFASLASASLGALWFAFFVPRVNETYIHPLPQTAHVT